MNKKVVSLLPLICATATALSVYQAWAIKPGAPATNAAAAPGSSQPAGTLIAPDAAWKLYTQRQFAASAQAYEALMAAGRIDARIVYCAALANREAQHANRAKQLFDYLQSNFPQSTEAAYAKQLTTPAGAAGTTATAGEVSATATTATATTGAAAGTRRSAQPRKKGAFVFTADEIAKEGASGVDQTNAANCWFESSMAALASLPKGQRLIARMITYGDGDEYIVRFPGDGVEYKFTEAEARASGVNNHALWATLLDYAQRKKFPSNQGAEGAYGDQSRLEVGLGCITGCKAEVIYPGHCGIEEIAAFVGGAVRSQNPIVAGTANRINSGPQPIVECHAYTIIGMDTARNMIILRNPHGRGSEKYSMPSDPQHLKFEQLEDGVLKMNLQTFHDSFGSAARSFI